MAAPGNRVRKALLALLICALGFAFVTWPRLPGAQDTYVHVLWTQQVMACFAHGQLPFWLPDMNAGFGSPGIRLYSPGGPVVAGLFGLLLGDAGRGMRLAVFLAVLALCLLARRLFPSAHPAAVLLWLANPMLAFSFLHRGAFSELYSLPLAFWLLERHLRGDHAPGREAVAWAGLWLVHAPTFVMVTGLSALAAVARRNGASSLGRWALGWLGGASLVAWHWLPLAREQRWVTMKAGLTEGVLDFHLHFLGANPLASPTTVQLSLLALAWVVLLLLAGQLQQGRTLLVLCCIALATPLALPLWELLPPLQLLQFPSRFLLSASLVLPGLFATEKIRGKKLLALVLFPLPLLWVPAFPLVRDPRLRAQESWQSLGAKMHASITVAGLGANPFLVEAAQIRPASFQLLAENIVAFGAARVLYPGDVEVTRWTPLVRVVQLQGPGGLARFRLLAYPLWEALLDGRPVLAREHEGVIAVWVPPGRHQVTLRWAGNPASRWGALAALLPLALLLRRSLRS
jgi:hypothetical protein